MSVYAKQVWKDGCGDLHDTEEEALLASRTYEIQMRMESTYPIDIAMKQGLDWFLDDADNIIKVYDAICQVVDDQMATP